MQWYVSYSPKTNVVCRSAIGPVYIICYSAVCDSDCQNGGVCSAPNTCNCSGTGYEGNYCETGELLFLRI